MRKLFIILFVIILGIVGINMYNKNLFNTVIEKVNSTKITINVQDNKLCVSSNRTIERVEIHINDDLVVEENFNKKEIELSEESKFYNIVVNSFKDNNKIEKLTTTKSFIYENNNEISQINDEFKNLGFENVYMSNLQIDKQNECYNIINEEIKFHPELKGTVKKLIVQSGINANAQFITFYNEDEDKIEVGIIINKQLLESKNKLNQIISIVHELSHALNFKYATIKFADNYDNLNYEKIQEISNEYENIANMVVEKVCKDKAMKIDDLKEIIIEKNNYENTATNYSSISLKENDKKCLNNSKEIIATCITLKDTGCKDNIIISSIYDEFMKYSDSSYNS